MRRGNMATVWGVALSWPHPHSWPRPPQPPRSTTALMRPSINLYFTYSTGFAKEQAETVVSALMSLSAVSLDTVYKDMVTQAQQEITLQQIMFQLDSIRKDMVILEKSEFANLRAENEKMKIELDQVKHQLMNETNQIRAENKLDINLERSRVTDMFTDQERKLMEASTEFHKKDSSTNSSLTEVNNKIDAEIAALKTLMESNKLETIRYLAASVFTCLAIALGFYRFWK
uniref:Coiled-coil domain containing 90B n=1 Tax=Pseudonaja textilis TaxID=8673 RepID=A0A670Y717_PSETE